MIRHYKLTLIAFALLLSSLLPIATEAATPPAPKIAFVGDWLTTGWSATFPANWINESNPVDASPSIAQQTAAAIALKPSLIHIMIGSAYWDDDASYNLVTAELETDLTQAILSAQAARIPVFVGMVPLQCTGPEAVSSMDFIAYAVATKYNVPTINYSGAFSNAQVGYSGSVNGTSGGTAQEFTGPFFTPTNTGTSYNSYSTYQPTAAGYAIMTMMAQTAFATVNAQPKSLYLQDTLLQGNECGSGCSNVPNVNTASPGNTVQFYPVITYTNGVTQQAALNVNFITGLNGTWTSSNPLVGTVNQSGEFWAFNEGTTTVTFTLPNGVWNEWIMYVGALVPG
jgi:hypothetical protein